MSRILSVIYFCSWLGLVFTYVGGKKEGDSCYHDGNPGQCILATECVKTFDRPLSELKICSNSGVPINGESIVCCPAVATTSTITTPRPVATPPPQTTKQTTTEYLPVTYDYDINTETVEGELAPDGCPPLDAYRTTPPQNITSWDRCLDYQRQIVYSCEESASLMGVKVRRNNCRHEPDACFMIPQYNARRDEFPHMALLGFGESNSTAVWKCAGTVISDRFILTAAHCTWTESSGYANYAIVGALRRSNDFKAQVHRIISRIEHPNYEALTLHNDIALLKTATMIQFSQSVVPACLDVFGDDQTRAVASGWGTTSYFGGDANTLQKVRLKKFTDRECRDNYPVNRHGAVYNASIQVCYEGYERAADLCQGGSGGPLTVDNHRLRCMYTVISITSSGMHCGNVGVPGYYTRVAPFVPWIESIVWP